MSQISDVIKSDIVLYKQVQFNRNFVVVVF